MATLRHLAMTVSPVELRPRRIWFISAAVVALSGVLAAPAAYCDASPVDGQEILGASPAPILSIGDPPWFYDTRDTAVLSSVAFGVAGVIVIIGAVLAVVVAVRRRSHRARLLQQPTEANHG
ncbi:hypothetical protein [Micromonospora rubida]